MPTTNATTSSGFARLNGESKAVSGLSSVNGGWYGNIGLRVYLINPDGSPYASHPQVYDFYYNSSPNKDFLDAACLNGAESQYYAMAKDSDGITYQLFYLKAKNIPNELNASPILKGSCGEGGTYLKGIPEWTAGSISAIDGWMREISSNGKDKNLVKEILNKLYDIGVGKDEDALEDWENGDMEVVLENLAWYTQNCEGNDLLVMRMLSRPLTGQEEIRLESLPERMRKRYYMEIGVSYHDYPIQIYGTAKDMARWCLNNQAALGNAEGGWMHSFVGGTMPLGLTLSQKEENSSWTVPTQKVATGNPPRISLDKIIQFNEGYGMATWRCLDGERGEDLREEWVTNDPSGIGSSVPRGDSPGSTPDMPEDSDGSARKIRIIKIYADKIKEGTNIYWEPKGTFTTQKVTNQIQIQEEEPINGYKMKLWWVSSNTTEFPLYYEKGTVTPAQTDRIITGGTKGTSENTVLIDDKTYKTVYVYLEKTVEKEPDPDTKMELYESEITHRYLISKVTDLKDDEKTVKFKWDAYNGSCTTQITGSGHVAGCDG